MANISFDDSVIAELQDSLKKIKDEEDLIDSQILDLFESLVNTPNVTQKQKKTAFQSPTIQGSIKALDEFSPCFEAISLDCTRLTTQLSDCKLLSDQMSQMVKRLDTLQIRVQQALACTEDILNLKDCKLKLAEAIESHNLSTAIHYIMQYHTIDPDIAKASDDIGMLQQYERDIKKMVQTEFNQAVTDKNINQVMSLCPMLQTLGLSYEARDIFLNFMETHIFIAVTADLSTTTTSTSSSNDDASTQVDIYTKAISTIFNSTYIIFQQYLPIVIQGMESSYGDIHFIRLLHKKCETQIGMILKKYLKYRSLKTVLQTIQTNSTTAGNKAISTSGAGSLTNTLPNVSTMPSIADLHIILDELALFIQYCNTYYTYLKQLCTSAESRERPQNTMLLLEGNHAITNSNTNAITTTSEIHIATSNKIIPPMKATGSVQSGDSVVFKEQTDYELMMSELSERYYIPIETYLIMITMKSCIVQLQDVKATIIQQQQQQKNILMSSSTQVVSTSSLSLSSSSSYGLDECFYVLRRCGLRCIHTHTIHGTCAVLRKMTDMMTSELYRIVNDILKVITVRMISMLQDQLLKQICISIGYTLSGNCNTTGGSSVLGTGSSMTAAPVSQVDILSSSVTGVTQGFKTALSLASTINATTTTTTSVNTNLMSKDKKKDKDLDNGMDTLDEDEDEQIPDILGLGRYMKLYHINELCIRYCDQLMKEMKASGESIYQHLKQDVSNNSLTTTHESISVKRHSITGMHASHTTTHTTHNSESKTPRGGHHTTTQSVNNDYMKLQLCLEEFEHIKESFKKIQAENIGKIIAYINDVIKEVLTIVFHTTSGLHGGIRFDLNDDTFNRQPSLLYLPKSFMIPFEMILNVLTSHFSDTIRDEIVSQLAEIICLRLEEFISQTVFYYAGALQLDELIRGLMGLISKYSTMSIRHKFTKLKEIMSILTSDVTTWNANNASSNNGSNSNNASSNNNSSNNGSNSGSSSSVMTDTFHYLTTSQILTYQSLRLDAK